MIVRDAIQTMRAIIGRKPRLWVTEDGEVRWVGHHLGPVSEIPSVLCREARLERLLTEPALKRYLATCAHEGAFNSVAFFHKIVLGNALGEERALRATWAFHARDINHFMQNARATASRCTSFQQSSVAE